MSDEPRDRVERLEALWLRYLAGETTGTAELAAEIRSGGPLADALVADESLHRMLNALGRSAEDEQAFVHQVGQLVAAEASVERFVSAVEKHIDAGATHPRPAAPTRSARWPFVVAPLALMAAAAFALWLRSPQQPPAPVTLAGAALPATLVTGTLGSGLGRLHPGQAIPEGVPLSSDEGRACLRLAGAGQICLERATRMRLAPGGARGVALEAGKVAATVTHQKAGASFTISTPAAEVTALGTAFSVELAEDRTSAITRVVRGAVGVLPRGRGLSTVAVTVKAHEALSLASGAPWRMSAEEERDEWSLIRGHTAALLTAPTAETVGPPDVAGETAGADVAALLALADALRARGRLRDAQGMCDELARLHPRRPDIERVAAELRAPPPPTPWNATPAVYRINAGGSRYVDPRGNTWSADTHFNGGDTGEFFEEIDGTDMDPLYQSERVVFPGENLSYNLPLTDGQYVVRLHFAEIWAGTVKRDMRKFDVLIEGERVLASYDIAAEVGPMTAMVKQVVTSVQDGSLDIDFKHVVENPKISAIEVFALPPGTAPPPAPAPPTVFPPLPLPPTDALYRVNAGGREYVDRQGRRWEADSYFNDTGLGAAKYLEIAGTDLDPLYQTQRRAYVLPIRPRLTYSFPVPPGRYLLRLHFAELHVTAAGSGVFDVLVESADALKRLDVFAEVGNYAALVKEVETTVTDGALDLSFRAIAGRPEIAAIEVIPRAKVLPAPPSGGCALGGPAPPATVFIWLLVAAALWRRAPRRSRGS